MIRTSRLIIYTLFALLLSAFPAFAVQEVKEVHLVDQIMKQNVDACTQILKAAYKMREQALPFTHPKYQAKYRFSPSDTLPRSILSLSRSMRSRFKLLSGILYHVPVRNRTELFKSVDTSLDTLTNSSKRALRAIRDGNSALFLASANTADKEARLIYKLLGDFEDIINDSIEKSDAASENL